MAEDYGLKKFLAIIIVLALGLGLAACGGGKTAASSKPQPEDAVIRLCEAIKSFDPEAVDACVEGDNGAAQTVAELGNIEAGLLAVMKKGASALSYDVGKATVSGDTATVPVRIEYTDASHSVSAVMDAYVEAIWDILESSEDLSDATKKISDDLFDQAIDERWDTVKNDRKTFDINLQLHQKDEDWLLNDLPPELVLALTSNVGGAINAYMGWDDTSGGDSLEIWDGWRDHKYYDWSEYELDEITADYGEALKFEGSQLKVTGFQELPRLENSEETYEAEAGAKFLLFEYEVTNTGSTAINFSNDMLFLCNDKGWLYEEYYYDYLFMDHYLWNTPIAPGETETSTIIFYVPDTISNDEYYLAVTDLDKKVYKVYGK